MDDLLQLLKPYQKRILWSMFGLLIAILWITLGFGYMLLILLCTAIGFMVGKWQDGSLDIQKWMNFFTK